MRLDEYPRVLGREGLNEPLPDSVGVEDIKLQGRTVRVAQRESLSWGWRIRYFFRESLRSIVPEFIAHLLTPRHVPRRIEDGSQLLRLDAFYSVQEREEMKAINAAESLKEQGREGEGKIMVEMVRAWGNDPALLDDQQRERRARETRQALRCEQENQKATNHQSVSLTLPLDVTYKEEGNGWGVMTLPLSWSFLSQLRQGGDNKDMSLAGLRGQMLLPKSQGIECQEQFEDGWKIVIGRKEPDMTNVTEEEVDQMLTAIENRLYAAGFDFEYPDDNSNEMEIFCPLRFAYEDDFESSDGTTAENVTDERILSTLVLVPGMKAGDRYTLCHDDTLEAKYGDGFEFISSGAAAKLDELIAEEQQDPEPTRWQRLFDLWDWG